MKKAILLVLLCSLAISSSAFAKVIKHSNCILSITDDDILEKFGNDELDRYSYLRNKGYRVVVKHENHNLPHLSLYIDDQKNLRFNEFICINGIGNYCYLTHFSTILTNNEEASDTNMNQIEKFRKLIPDCVANPDLHKVTTLE